jgi:hypothetical protein
MIICPDDQRIRPDGSYDISADATERAWDDSYAQLAGHLQTDLTSITLLVGVPGCGKSTWAYGKESWLKGEHAGDVREVIIDATLTRRIERLPLIQMAQRHHVPVHAVVFMTPLDECISRNSVRPPGRRVPFNVIARMYENLRREPVTLDEGFESISVGR